MEKTKWDCLSRRDAFENVTLEDCVKFTKDLRQNCWLQMHIEGNFYQSEAEKLYKDTVEALQGEFHYFFFNSSKTIFQLRI